MPALDWLIDHRRKFCCCGHFARYMILGRASRQLLLSTNWWACVIEAETWAKSRA